jgi:DNA-binding transcriptional LysR family regulator
MNAPDLNLLFTLDAVLTEGSVARAAKRLGLSPSATSRALARLRETTGDPLLVRAGRGLVPTPRALELRDRVGALVREAHAVLSPAEKPDLEKVSRTFTIRSRDGFVENFGPSLLERVRHEAPRVLLRFVQKHDRDAGLLREGSVDLETGVVGAVTNPELLTRGLFKDRFIGVVRADHPLSQGEVTLDRYLAGRHVNVEDILEPAGVERDIAAVVNGFSTALALARASDLIATLPERHTSKLRSGMHSFALPVPMPDITISMLWHPRMHADPVHRWLRGCVKAVCAESGAD